MSETKSVTKPVYKKGKITGIIIRVINDKEGVVVGNEEECFPLGYTFTISSASHWDTVDFEEKTKPFIEKPTFPQIADMIESMPEESFQSFGDEKVVTVTKDMEYLHHIQNWKDTETSSEPKELVQETLHPSFSYDTVAVTSHLLGANKF